MPTQCQTPGLYCRVSSLGSLEMISKDESTSLHGDMAISLCTVTVLLGMHCSQACTQLLQVTSAPQADFQSRRFDSARSMPLLSGQPGSRLGKNQSLTPSLPLTDANCSLSVNFREPKISSVLFRISASQAARYALEGNSTVPAFKRSHRNTPLPSHRWY